MARELDAFRGLHAPGERQEFTLCGMAPEAFETGDADEPVVIAEPGEAISCPTCCRTIDYVRRNFRAYRYRPVEG